MYDHKILYEFDYGTYWTRTNGVVCPWIRKFANIDQSVPNLMTIYIYAHNVSDKVKSNQNIQSYLTLNLEKLLNLTLFTL